MLAGWSFETTAAPRAASAQLHQLLASMNSYSAQFMQHTRDAEGQTLQRASGVFEFAKPQSMRWITLQPMTQHIITDGRSLWVYDADLEQVIVDDFNRQMSATPAMIFSESVASIDATYRVERREPDEAVVAFILTPRDDTGLLSSIELTFIDSALSGVSITSAEEINQFDFLRVQLNPVISSAAFSFEVPTDVEVIDNRQ
ncbi:MAG: outer membrane lipoprotein chaperone LolA [Cellvibrionales bacterium]|tara:strand:- start:4718 stop:5320 length:603 start_codon:yes stop_codon:yes gene_type:complete